MSILDNFDSWKGFLADRLEQAQANGADQKTISGLAAEVGDYLAQSVNAQNPEEEVLKELWNAASEEEQQALANTMIKLVQKK
ncbi:MULTISPECIES: DUF3243 domain-containing protein [Oceanobacillus]|uniref:DUF3243 domain-containing protein n=1 Tax=Oceanobacillus kimchii TaxID=746691 RepID=A0ABQ5TK54_9BACI|nr:MULTISPECIES: DUF3243 domain-containing protein [Oceanobacillus]MBT2598645.1 DUF3243 domain-containing protein [Oceanobacillus sp. ISL-74]MBT2651564.1 DUF3243 domain-containing protein [Oceanobacillus sp. ISL-73]MCT1576213.1 DUF3243 domain-containing protein [Oceanobacillus kimchii]MCT2135850.1 DUF3243 domain-containing protein [Oceanobacillus kimchii]OEH54724.1 hypothetical protein AQ616_13280 [Oceanobacillus sp. E9]